VVHRKIIIAVTLLVGTGSFVLNVSPIAPIYFSAEAVSALAEKPDDSPLNTPAVQLSSSTLPTETVAVQKHIESTQKKDVAKHKPKTRADAPSEVFTVPFFSQFHDITSAEWKKVGCGVTSLAMMIDFYKPGTVSVDTLLQEGIKADAYLTNDGWTYAGLIGLTQKYGLEGTSHDMASMSMERAFNQLKITLRKGPAMVSVHYTFNPLNPIPHLVVVNGITDEKVYYNDPAEESGGGSISISQFQKSWKKRYIEIHPVS
jgi:uncharacterized protein YvpB